MVDYDTLLRVPIIRNVCGTSERGIGMAVGWLAVSRISKWDDRWGIFVLDTGNLILRCRFVNFEVAYEIAKAIERVYREYWLIISRDGCPDLSLFELIRWSIPNGDNWVEAVKYMEKQDIIDWKSPIRLLEKVGEKTT